jgi:hypothetical protein
MGLAIAITQLFGCAAGVIKLSGGDTGTEDTATESDTDVEEVDLTCSFFTNGEAEFTVDDDVDAEGGYVYGGTGVYYENTPRVGMSIFSESVEVYQGEPSEVSCDDSSAIACYEVECTEEPRDEVLILP